MEIRVSNGVLSSSLVRLASIPTGANDAPTHQIKGEEGLDSPSETTSQAWKKRRLVWLGGTRNEVPQLPGWLRRIDFTIYIMVEFQVEMEEVCRREMRSFYIWVRSICYLWKQRVELTTGLFAPIIRHASHTVFLDSTGYCKAPWIVLGHFYGASIPKQSLALKSIGLTWLNCAFL